MVLMSSMCRADLLPSGVWFPLSYLVILLMDPTTAKSYSLSLHDALPICPARRPPPWSRCRTRASVRLPSCSWPLPPRSEEHTSELQSRGHLVCRLLLEKKKTTDGSTEGLIQII